MRWGARVEDGFVCRKSVDGDSQAQKYQRKYCECFGCARLSFLLAMAPLRHVDSTYHYSVIPREKSQFNQSSYKIVPCGDVAGNEDEDGHSRERVHSGSFYRNSMV
jgi:hypothetical protein